MRRGSATSRGWWRAVARCCNSRKHWFVSFLKEKEIFVSSFKEKEISFSSLKENASSYLLRGEGAVPPPSPSRRRRCLFLSPSRIKDEEISPLSELGVTEDESMERELSDNIRWRESQC